MVMLKPASATKSLFSTSRNGGKMLLMFRRAMDDSYRSQPSIEWVADHPRRLVPIIAKMIVKLQIHIFINSIEKPTSTNSNSKHISLKLFVSNHQITH